ncbi:DUF3800 domain-containing protein [Gordonibacter massiliensis (ex Traore et al. 2017)]|uniref:DUF3800 domain-containing protein n=1 Tax=Gordonibacter massiliensis (ex Traore et al. 2017) TaxID=1841863 RepID=A0A842JAA9_9ACTN|nr:DUF3800 domain-containing protein [Gordonibacter massiliensis (ex Traore et al. 2017)]
MSELSIFIDESGDFGSNSEYYLLTLVFHDQSNPIDEEIVALRRKLADLGLSTNRAIHAGPIVRKEAEYANLSLSTRRSAFGSLYAFTRKAKVVYFTIAVKKKECPDRIRLKNRLARELASFFRDHMQYFLSFDKVIVYYDNGQAPITELIGTVCGSVFFEVDYRKVAPSDYRLFQSADLLCTLELAGIKADAGKLSRSEEIFFESRRKLKKNYLCKLDTLKFPSR